MKRFACHLLYLSADECLSRQVIQLNDEGRVEKWFPLTEEISFTQWLGGAVVLSPFSQIERMEGECFADFLARVSEAESFSSPIGLYAWQIVGFSLAEREFIPPCRFVRLG